MSGSKIKNKIVVLSGKGGVGKSTVAVNLAIDLIKKGNKVGILDVDLHGPSVPIMLGLKDQNMTGDENELFPIKIRNLSVISVGFMLENSDDAVIWRGPMKYNVIKQFIEQVQWGELDYLIIDSPPGTGDEPLTVCQLLKESKGAVIVTTPQEVAVSDVRRTVTFCNRINMPIIGIIENMSGFSCPHCGKVTEIFKSGGGKEIAKKYNIQFLGSVPINPEIGISGDEGKPFIGEIEQNAPVSKIFSAIAENITKTVENKTNKNEENEK